MNTSELSVRIHRPVSEVYAYLMDPSNYLFWQSGLIEVSATNAMKVGSVISFKSVALGTRFNLTAQVTENQPTKFFRVLSSRGPITFDALYRLEEDGKQTVVTLINIIDTNSVFRLAEPVLQSISDSQYASDLATLKAILEGSTSK